MPYNLFIFHVLNSLFLFFFPFLKENQDHLSCRLGDCCVEYKIAAITDGRLDGQIVMTACSLDGSFGCYSGINF